ncbi:unnamed protein product [Closterium sp. NIES-53]
MDLGSLVCSPSSPSCSACPLSPHCRALALQQQWARRGEEGEGGEGEGAVRVTDFPVRKAKAAPREEWVAVCVVERRGAAVSALASEASAGVPAKKGRRVQGSPSGNQSSSEEPSQYLLVQRPPTGLLAGLWEFPSLVVTSGTGRPAEAQRRQAVRQLLGQMLPCVTIEGSGQLSLDGRILQEGENKKERRQEIRLSGSATQETQWPDRKGSKLVARRIMKMLAYYQSISDGAGIVRRKWRIWVSRVVSERCGICFKLIRYEPTRFVF